MEFSEELTEELAGKLRSLTANLRKTQKKSPDSEIKLEIYDPINETNLIESLESVPDFSVILEELNFPDKIKIDVFVDGQKKKSSVFFEKKEEKEVKQNYVMPQNNYQPPNYSQAPDFREIMTGLERMVGSMTTTQKEIIDSSLKLHKESLQEMKSMMVEHSAVMKNLSDEKIKFESTQRTNTISNMQTDYDRKIKIEMESFEERLKREKEHQELLRGLEIDRAKISKDSTSHYVQNVNASIEITKAVVEAVKDVVPGVMETILAVKAANATNITPIEAV